MIDTVIFDIGNVLVSFDWQAHLESAGFSPEKYEIVTNATYQNPDWVELDRGVLTMDEILARMIRKAPEYAEDIRWAVESLGECVKQKPYTKEWLAWLKEKGIKRYYLSNYSDHAYRVTKKELDFLDEMDGGVFSYKVQLIKPCRWIYEELIAKYNVTPENAVFFDDIQENIEGAKKAGLHAFQFTDYEIAKQQLKELGV